MDDLSRRAFLARFACVGVAAMGAGALPAWARAVAADLRPGAAPAGLPDLIERNDWPEHWETTLEALGRSWLTGNHRFFVRSHFPVPAVDPASYRLEVGGRVGRPLTLTLADLMALPLHEATHTLECAGNGRGLYPLANTSGTQWERGAIGNATWGGVKLSLLLQRAGVLPEAKHVWFEGADHATLPSVPPFLRSVPIDKAMADTMLAHTMNGEPLPELHGAPLRTIVPGWYGMASTKWVTRVRVEDAPSDNHFMAKGYRYTYPGEDPAAAAAVEEMRVKSVITRPLAGSRVPLGTGKVRIQGFAWAGTSGVRLVEVSADGGKTWRPAGFMGENAPMAWRAWATEVEVKKPTSLTVMARATDGAGVTQPLEAKPNLGGYANNSIHKVTFRVRA